MKNGLDFIHGGGGEELASVDSSLRSEGQGFGGYCGQKTRAAQPPLFFAHFPPHGYVTSTERSEGEGCCFS
jgi:hypothetical protein